MNPEPDSLDATTVAPLHKTDRSASTRIQSGKRVWERTNDVPTALALGLIGLVTRLLAVPASLWEWDDILFARSLHRFNLVEHSPHPPGFPVFVMIARAAFHLLHDERLALVTVALVFGTLLAPALFYFYREVFEDRNIAIAGALLGSFAPNVWVQGAMGRSDGPGMTVAVIALALILHGLRSNTALLLGCAVFGLGMGVRITLLPIVAPTLAIVLLLRLMRKEWKLAGSAIVVAGLAALCWYLPLVIHTTWRLYRWVLQQHSQFTLTTDSIWAKNGNAVLSYRATRFFGEIWGAPWIMWTIYGLGALGIILLAQRRRWQALGWMAVAFVPFIIFTFILNTPMSAPLYSMPYVPLFTGLAACGLVMAPRLIGRLSGVSTIGRLGLPLAAGLTIALMLWTYPVIRMVHREVSPSVTGMNHLRARLDAQRDALIFDGLFSPHVDFYLPRLQKFLSSEAVSPEFNLILPFGYSGHFFGVRTEPGLGSGEEHLTWSGNPGKERLRILSLGRYFDVYLGDLSATHSVRFLSGWYEEMRRGAVQWRWMSRKGTAAVLNRAETMTLRLRAGSVTPSGSGGLPTIVLRLDGAEVDRFRPEKSVFERIVTLRPDQKRIWSRLEIETDQSLPPSLGGPHEGDDHGELGLQCLSLEWSPAENAPLLLMQNHFLGSGWFDLEGSGSEWRRGIAGVATAHLPAIVGDGRLDLTLEMPQEELAKHPEVTISIDGQSIDRFQPAAGRLRKTYLVPAAVQRGQQVELQILTSPSGDGPKGTPVAMQVYYLGWVPAEAKKQ